MKSHAIIDYHMHTAVTIDGKMNETQACERAVLLGIQEIAFTNHIMLNHPNYLMSPQAFSAHFEQIQICQRQYPQLKILVGVEMDYYIDREQEIAGVLQNYEKLIGRPFDIVLGSIHEMNGIFFSSKDHAPGFYKDRDLTSIYNDYFVLATKAVRSRIYDIMAHPDLVKKYTHELTPPLPFKEFRPAVESYVDALIESGVGMEWNTKGLVLMVKEAYPSNEILELYISKARKAGVEPILTMGSDAHKVDDVGNYILEGVDTLRTLGVRKISNFEKRKRFLVEIEMGNT